VNGVPKPLSSNKLTYLTAARQPIKNLPATINITNRTTVQDVKVALAQQAGGMDPNRLGIFDSKKKILKDHKALVSKNKDVLDAQEVFVKDLGMILYYVAFPSGCNGLAQTHLWISANFQQARRYHGLPFSLSNMLGLLLFTFHSSSFENTYTKPTLHFQYHRNLQWLWSSYIL